MPGQGRIAILSRWLPLTAKLESGQLLAKTEQIGSEQEQVIDFIALTATPYIPCLCFLYHGEAIPANFIIKSNDAGQDTFEGLLTIHGGESLSLLWAGQIGSAVLKAKLHYTLYQVVNVPYDPTLLTQRGPR